MPPLSKIDPSAIAPSLFISHGSPMLALADAEDDETVAMLQTLQTRFGEPKSIIVLSAHRTSQEQTIEIDASPQFHTMPDFSGFPKALYEIQYPMKGSPELAVRVAALVQQNPQAGIKELSVSLVKQRLADHGIWIPLMKAFSQPKFSILPISLPSGAEPRHFLALGKALGPLRQEGVWIIGSGGAVHNLGLLNWSGKRSIPDAWALNFEQWIIDRMIQGQVEELTRFEEEAPESARAHPTTEHFLPLLFAVGASQKGDQFIPLHRGIEYGSLSMLSFALHPELRSTS